MSARPDSDRFDVLRAADFRFLIERKADGILVLDESGAVLFANPAAEAAFGRPAADLVGADIGLPVVAGETTEIAILRPGGDQITAEMRVVATTWEGRPALLVSLRDISARKAEEERARQAHKMESIGRLTAGIAHDFNNLLTVVMGNLTIIQREAEAMDSPRLARAAAHAMEGANRAATLTQRLLAFARRQPLEPRPVDVNKLVLGMTELLHRSLGEGIEVQTDLAEGGLQVLADPNQLESAILNLAVNARDAMPEGGRLRIETRASPPDLARPDLAPGPYVEVRICDTGVGMTDDVVAQAFEPFFTTKEVGRGTGLGLSQVFGFVKQTGGDVGIESRPGDGTTITLYLPRSAAAPAGGSAAGESRPGRPGETILVVDDEEGVRRYSAGALEELGYRVLEAGDAATALRILEEHPEIQLLFTDIGLPGGLNGRELADRAREKRSDLKVLLTSGYTADALVRGGRLAPGVQLLPKPFTYAALRSKVRSVLDAANRASRILVVEDDAFVRMTVVETLMDGGCRVEEAATASEAVSKLRTFADELEAAIVDVGLPDGRGDRLIADLRAIRPGLLVLLSTGYADAVTDDTVASEEGVGVLEKPFDGPRLRAALSELGVSLA